MSETMEHGPMYDPEWDVDLSDFLSDDGGADQATNEAEEPTETQEQPEVVETTPETQQEAEQEHPSAESKPEEPANSDVFDLKHMGTTTQVDRQRVTELAQMGLDYDRVKGQRDEFRKQADELRQYKDENAELVDFIRDLAKQSGMSAEQLMDEIRVNQYVQRNNVSQEVARERVAREKAERRLQQQEARQAPKLTPEQEKKERMNKDIREFFQAFPNVKPDEIDKSVWDGVNQGKSLKDSYQEYLHRKQEAEKDAEIQRLRAELEAQKKNQENRAKTIGSQKAGSQEDAKDKFLEAFMSDD